MMKVYARIVDGKVWEIIPPYANEQGVEIPVEDRYAPYLVAQMVDITGMDPQPDQEWTYDGTNFAAPVPYVPSPEDILNLNRSVQAALIRQASQSMAPILVSLQLGDATDAETLEAKAWQAYYRALQAVDMTVTSPAWPEPPAS